MSLVDCGARIRTAVAIAALASAPGLGAAIEIDDVHPWLRIESESYSEPASVLDTVDVFRHGSFHGGDIAFTHNEIGVGVEVGAWTVAAIWRLDYHLRFHDDLAELVFTDKQDLPVAADRDYRLRASVNQIEASGVRVARLFNAGRAQLALGVTALRATHMIDGRARGNLRFDTADFPTGAVALRQAYTEDEILSRPQESSTGWGLGLDAAATIPLGERWTLRADVRDLATFVRWSNSPFTDVTLFSQSASLDPDGRLRTQPILSGRESERLHWQRLPIRHRAEIAYAVTPRIGLVARERGYEGELFPEAGLDWIAGDGYRLRTTWGLRDHAIRLEGRIGRFFLSLATEQANIDRAHSIAFTFSYGRPSAGN